VREGKTDQRFPILPSL